MVLEREPGQWRKGWALHAASQSPPFCQLTAPEKRLLLKKVAAANAIKSPNKVENTTVLNIGVKAVPPLALCDIMETESSYKGAKMLSCSWKKLLVL